MRWLWLFISVLLSCLPLWSGASAQSLSGSLQGEVELSVASLGVGGFARAGDWAGVLVEFTDLGDAQREVVIQVETRDVDGDRPSYRRTVTTNPGAGAERVWIYAFLQPDAVDVPLTVSAYEAEPLTSDQADRVGVRFAPGRLLGRTTSAGQTVQAPELAGMLVIGRAPAGLTGYSSREKPSDIWLPFGHEVTSTFSGVTPAMLPDRVAGLVPFETIIWTTEEPTRLTPARGEALRQWVEMGGHLVVCLTATPQLWQDRARNPIAELLPEVEFNREQLVSVEDIGAIRPLLTYEPTARMPDRITVVSLVPKAAAGPHEAMPILQDGEGRTLVARRLLGLGMVTLVGIDVTSRELSELALPGTRPFWHRILGRVGIPQTEAANASGTLSLSMPRPRYFDLSIANLIAKGQAVVLGVVAGFTVFGLYWVIAGPASYFILGKLGIKRHAWLVFTGVAGLFTVLSWGLVTAVRPSKPDATVVVFVDAVDGVDVVRTRSFASVLVPKYGEGRLTLSQFSDQDVSLLSPWTAGQSSLVGASGAFPDARGYAVSGRDPDTLEFPARATVKTIRADWYGERTWAMPRAIDATGREGAIRVGRDGALTGSIRHGLPGPLRDGIVVVVPGQVPLWRQVGQSDITDARVYTLIPRYRQWEPGQTIDLAEITARIEGQQGAAALQDQLDYFNDLIGSGSTDLAGFDPLPMRQGDVDEQLVGTAFMSRFRPPLPDQRGERPVALRRHTHGLDLGRWFTQPCVMVLGIVDLTADMPSPVPLVIGEPGAERSVPTSGIAVVRWVYPLDAAPPQVRRDAQDRFAPTGTGPQ